MITAFILNKLLVFKDSSQELYKSIIFFTLINILAIFQTWVISMGLNSYVFPYLDIKSNSEMFAHAIGVIFPVFTSYLGHKYLSFKTK
jgi:putative flippase GtrA